MSFNPKINDPKILTLVMPVYGEGDAVIPVISTLFFTVKYPFKLLVVYDSEDDITIDTIEMIKQHFNEIYLVQNKWENGALNAIKTGIAYSDTPYVGIWLPYHVDPFGCLNSIIEKLENGYDLVSANRFSIQGKKARGNKLKLFLSLMGNILLRNIIGIPIRDISFSLKVYKRSLLDSIDIETNKGQWAFSVEVTIKAAIQGYRLAEFDLRRKNVNLIHGITSFKVFKQLPDYLRWVYLGWRNRKIIAKHIQLNEIN